MHTILFVTGIQNVTDNKSIPSTGNFALSN
jgi:hypothetical protein